MRNPGLVCAGNNYLLAHGGVTGGRGGEGVIWDDVLTYWQILCDHCFTLLPLLLAVDGTVWEKEKGGMEGGRGMYLSYVMYMYLKCESVSVCACLRVESCPSPVPWRKM